MQTRFFTELKRDIYGKYVDGIKIIVNKEPSAPDMLAFGERDVQPDNPKKKAVKKNK